MRRWHEVPAQGAIACGTALRAIAPPSALAHPVVRPQVSNYLQLQAW
ncbi:hypothetical protein [Scytonema sp. PCC 10023]